MHELPHFNLPTKRARPDQDYFGAENLLQQYFCCNGTNQRFAPHRRDQIADTVQLCGYNWQSKTSPQSNWVEGEASKDQLLDKGSAKALPEVLESDLRMLVTGVKQKGRLYRKGRRILQNIMQQESGWYNLCPAAGEDLYEFVRILRPQMMHQSSFFVPWFPILGL